MEQQKKEAIELSKIEVEYKPLKRAADQEEKMYSIIANRQKEIDITGPMKTNNVRVLERAVVPGAPVRPKPVQSLMLGLLLGLGTGIGLAFAIEALDNTLKTQADVEQLLGTPVLGLVPIIGAAAGADAAEATDHMRERDLGVFLDPKSVAAECCRSIRTNILFMSPDRPLKTIVVTSPSPQEGKTTTAINLGVTMAEAGGRVLIIDTDMRRPRLHRSFGVPNQTGISTVIVGKATLQEAIKRTDVPNLDILPCGPVPPNPSELIHTDRFGAVLAECGKLYDRDHPRLSADVGGHRSRRSREPRGRRDPGHQGGRDHPRCGDPRAPAARDRQGAPGRRGRERDRLLESGVRLRVLLPQLLSLRLHVRQCSGSEDRDLGVAAGDGAPR